MSKMHKKLHRRARRMKYRGVTFQEVLDCLMREGVLRQTAMMVCRHVFEQYPEKPAAYPVQGGSPGLVQQNLKMKHQRPRKSAQT